MARILITGMKQWDGEYELDTDHAFNAREWRWIKKVSGYMPLTVRDGFAGGDPDLFVALACIAMCRDGKITRDDGLRVADEIAESHGVGITLMGDEVEDDQIPLDLTSEPDEPSPTSSLSNDESRKPNETSSGMTSPTLSVSPDATLPPTTLLRLGTS